MNSVRWPLAALVAGALPAAGGFLRLDPLPAPRISAAAEEYPGGSYAAARLLDDNPKTEYASHGQGTNTFVEFDFGAPVRIGGFRHQDRNDVATISRSELTFLDAAGAVLSTAAVPHVNRAGGVTFFALPEPVTAQRVRWRASVPGSPHGCLGGASIAFLAAGAVDPQPGGIGLAARTVQILTRTNGVSVQPLRLTLDHPYAQPVRAVVRVAAQEPRTIDLSFGSHALEYLIPAVATGRTLAVAVEAGGATVVSKEVELGPARRLTVYMLPHSHTDIGYTAVQTDIEEKQIHNLVEGIAAARRTAGHPAGARFVWNVEVLWAADLYLRRLPAERRDEFFDAVRRGQVALNGMYLNELTGLCRPEELIRLFRYSTQLGDRCGVPVDSAMISDVPGCTWGTVTAMAQAGIRYFSVAPNYFDRIGDILVEWENKPFWWIGPDGRSKVLVWIPFWGYAMSHRYRRMTPELVEDFCAGLEARGYPYDIAYVRWAGHGDNAVPDPAICDFVRDWNAAHESPRFVISSTHDAFAAFERRHGAELPEVRGDWTPYWEDGAGSSAAETALNRASSERLSQAETLWAMRDPRSYPAARFEEAWNHVLLYSEHTWGAWCSISQPASPFTADQWTIKQSYATAANLQSRQLLSDAAAAGPPDRAAARTNMAVDVYNTTSWPRTDIVTIPHELSEGMGFAADASGAPLPAQRLAGRELAVRVADLPPLAGRRIALSREGTAAAPGAAATAGGGTLDNGIVRVRLDPATGAIAELRLEGLDANLADTAGGPGLNDYLYLVGDDPGAAQRNGAVRISIRDRGPLVASLLVESDAPGCHKLAREVRIVAGSDCVELINTVDKKRIEAASYHAKEGKESLNFAFPFRIPDGGIRMDVPFGVIRPELDQMPSACKNWLTAGRWADVANRECGVTWVTLDAPLVQVGGLTATLLNSQTSPGTWRKTIGPTQTLVSWSMNNHWGTNYRAYQEGPVVFRFVLRPHRGTTDAEASRLATGFSQPLVPAPARGAAPDGRPLLRVGPAGVLVTGLKPSDDGRALIVRLFNPSAAPQTATLSPGARALRSVTLTDTGERAGARVRDGVEVPAGGLVALRVEVR
mgnify:CR=1 FL=1